MNSSLNHHKKAPEFSPLPGDVRPSVSRAIAGFPTHNPVPAVDGHPVRPHTDANNTWIWSAVNHHPKSRAQELRTVIAAILRRPWWNSQTHPPAAEVASGDPFDQLVEGPNNTTCVLCGADDGKACVKAHLDYHPQ